MVSSSTFLAAVALVASQVQAQYTQSYLPSNAPNTWQTGQFGTNQCGTIAYADSVCQNAYINSASDFCLFSSPYANSSDGNGAIGYTERFEVAWCLKDGYGTRLIPSGAIKGVHVVRTPDYIQVTGVGDLTGLNIPANDTGGELDPHGEDGNGNPIGGLVFGNTMPGGLQQYHEWTNFIGASTFCFRACVDGPRAASLCNHIFDKQGCAWNMPGNYEPGVFEDCLGDSTEPMGVYNGTTWVQDPNGQPATSTPIAHPAAPSSSCTPATLSYSWYSGSPSPSPTGAGSPNSNAGGSVTAAPTASRAAASGAASPGTNGQINLGLTALVVSALGVLVGASVIF